MNERQHLHAGKQRQSERLADSEQDKQEAALTSWRIETKCEEGQETMNERMALTFWQAETG